METRLTISDMAYLASSRNAPSSPNLSRLLLPFFNTLFLFYKTFYKNAEAKRGHHLITS